MIRLLLLAACLASPASALNDQALRRATVQIHFMSRDPDYAQPWQYGRQRAGSGSGIVLPGNRILTNGHVVANAVYIAVRKAGDVKKYPARVAYVGHDGETAVLTVDDPSFFKGTVPAEMGGVPDQRDKVAVYGFPIGGNDLSVTEGIVSRVGVTAYSHSSRYLLAVQTDAAINPGNSGGPVFKDGRLVGIAFQHNATPGAQNIGYVVPVPIIERFLKDIEDGRYDGIPDLGIWWQNTENEGLRRAYRLDPDASGVLVTKVAYGSSAWGVLKEGDVLVSLGGTAIGQDGTVPFRRDERLDLSDLVSRRQVGDEIEAVVVRAGKKESLRLKLKRAVDLVPGPRYDEKPAYMIVGGLVFMPLSDDFINARGGTFLLRSLSADGVPTPERTEVVVLAQTLAHDVNRGYHSMAYAAVERVNGRPIGCMRDFVSALKTPLDGRIVIEVDNHSGFGENKGTRIVFDAAEAAKAMPEILKRFGVSADRSDDLKSL